MFKKCSEAQLGGKLRHTGGNEAHDKHNIKVVFFKCADLIPPHTPPPKNIYVLLFCFSNETI